MKNTAIIIIYFGNIPNYIKLFLKSCAYQENIDFYFFTDWNWHNLYIPDNVKNIPFDKECFNDLATRKCSIRIDIANGYKLCDIKPAWPHIFEDYVKEYNFVGWCDIDLIFGDINSIFSESLKMKYDLLTVTKDYISGALTIMRNIDSMRLLYQQARGWKQIFQDERHFAFDEILRVKGVDYESFSDVVKRLNNTSFSALFMNVAYECRPNLVVWDRGHVFAEGNSYIFFHYVVAKQSAFFVIPSWSTIPDRFYVNKWGFYKEEKNPLLFCQLFVNLNYIRQIYQAVKKKGTTAIRLFQRGDLKKILKVAIKQFR